MNTKTIFAAATVAVSLVTFSTLATAKPILITNCVITNTCTPILKPIYIPNKPILNPIILPLPMPPQPKSPDFNIDVNLGGGGNYNDGISCGEGRSIVRHRGYKKVHAIDCSGDTFTYAARKHGQLFEVDVNMNGIIVDVSSSY